MLNYNEVTPRKYITLDGEPYEVLSSHVFRKQQRKPVNQTKLKNLISGKVLERSFHQSDTIIEADLETKKVKFIYSRGDMTIFCNPDDKSDRFEISLETLEGKEKYIKEGDVVDALLFDERIIGVKIPIKVDLKVTMAVPAVKGNTSQGATKDVELETGMTVSTPLFIKEGDILRINTDTGEYTERVS